MQDTRVICQICGEVIALVNLSDIRFPIQGTMFGSPDPFHGFPPPFPPESNWDNMRCPYGNHRPFLDEYYIPVLTITGVQDLYSTRRVLCPICGKEFTNKGSLAVHMKTHRKDEEKVGEMPDGR